MGDSAILLTCHGTVERVEEIPEFVRNIRHGRPAPEEVVTEVRRRFEHIGGSPLMRITRRQAAELESRLGLPVRAAARLWEPYPRPVLQALHAEGIRRVVSLPLAPQSVHVYHAAVRDAADGLGIQLREAPSWGTHPALVGAFVEAIGEAHARFAGGGEVHVLLTAHSLPLRVIASGDPYESDFRAMADAVRRELVAAGFDDARISVAFQSQGMGGGEWLGPSLASSFAELRAAGVSQLLVAPIGFVAEHVETLYDIDVEAAALATSLGFDQLERMPAMNTRPRFIDALEAVAREQLGAAD